MTYYVHKDWPRPLIHKATGVSKDFNGPEGVPPGWFTVDGEEVNPAPLGRVSDVSAAAVDPETIFVHDGQAGQFVEVNTDASQQALRTVRGGGSDAKPRGKRRGRRHSEPDGGDPSVSPIDETG